jgi:hypothetical protein
MATRLSLCGTKDDTTYTIEEFAKAQAERKELFLEKLAKTLRDAREVIVAACDDTLRTATAAGNGEVDLFATGESTQTLHYAELAQRRNECRRLTGFIRLVDYLFADTLANVVYSSVREILEKIALLEQRCPDPVAVSGVHRPGADVLADMFDEAHAPQKQLQLQQQQQAGGTKRKIAPLFRVFAELQGEQIALNPSEEVFSAKIEESIAGYATAVASVEKLVMHEDFRPYTQLILEEQLEQLHSGAAQQEGLGLVAIIQEDKAHQRTCRAIRQAISRGYAASNKFSGAFGPFLAMYLED